MSYFAQQCAFSGIQIFADDKWITEGWYEYPASQARLLSILATTKTEGVIFLSESTLV